MSATEDQLCHDQTRRVPLTQGRYAVVDSRDFNEVSKFSWFARKTSNTYYALRGVRVSGKQSYIYMHRQILGAVPGEFVDHKDGNGLNNARSNIRKCSRTQNCQSFRVFRSTKTILFRGVTRKRSAFRARITVNKKEISLGVFPTPEKAATAYDAAAIKFFGAFAQTNFSNN